MIKSTITKGKISVETIALSERRLYASNLCGQVELKSNEGAGLYTIRGKRGFSSYFELAEQENASNLSLDKPAHCWQVELLGSGNWVSIILHLTETKKYSRVSNYCIIRYLLHGEGRTIVFSGNLEYKEKINLGDLFMNFTGLSDQSRFL